MAVLIYPSIESQLLQVKGDIVAALADNSPARLAAGADGTVLKADSAQAAGLVWGSASGMLKTQNNGYYQIPTAPAVGVSVSSGVANTYGSWAEIISSTAEAIYIAGISLTWDTGTTGAPTYVNVALATGAALSESQIGEISHPGYDPGADAGLLGHVVWLPALIPVATSTRIAAKSADSLAGTDLYRIALVVVAQADVTAI